MKIFVERNGKIKKTTVKRVIVNYRPLIEKICHRWHHSFYFDRSLTVEDLIQELTLKLNSTLHSYDYRKSGITTYIRKIATNFFYNKRDTLLTENRYPTSMTGNGNGRATVSFISLSERHRMMGEDVELVDMIATPEVSPETKILYDELVKTVRVKLQKEKYTPNNFLKKKKTFTLKIFDLMLSDKEKWQDAILLNHRQRLRYAKKYKARTPNRVSPSASAVATYLNVDHRTVIKALKIIRKTIKDVAGED